MYEPRTLAAALHALGELLADQGYEHQVVAIGGGALSLLGLIERSTEDIDLVGILERDTLQTAEPLPATLVAAIADVAQFARAAPEVDEQRPHELAP